MKKPVKILIVEDNPDDAEILLGELRRAGFDPQWKRVQQEEDFLAELKNAPDVVLSDYSMPTFDGLRAAKLVQESGLNIPFILISGTVGEDIAVAAMKHGATDYLLKDRIARLGTAVGQALDKKRLQEERKRTEEELRFQKTLLEAQSEASLDGILTVDANANIISFNRRFAEMWEVPKELLAGRSHKPVLKSMLDRIVDSGQFLDRVRYLYEHRDLSSREDILLKDGRVFDRHTSPVKGVDGAYYGRIWTFRDITSRKQAEEELQKSEERFRQMAENIDEVFWLRDAAKNAILYVSPAYEEIWGRRCADLYASPEAWIAAIHPEDRDRVHEVWATKTVEDFDVEYRVVRPDGSIRWIHDRAFAVRDSKGKVHRIAGMARDITERKLAMARIEEQAALLDKAQDAIVTRDLSDGRILFWNKGAENIYGWTREEALAADTSAPIGAENAGHQKAYETMLREGEWAGELEKTSKDGRKLTVAARWTLVRDNMGKPKSLLAISTDITEKKKIEAQFLRAQRMESIGTLAGGVAHDLNNILAPIMLSIEILREKARDPHSQSVLETIENSAQRGADIVRQILSFARGIEGQRVEVQLRHLLKDIESIVKGSFPKNIEWRISAPHDTWTALGDPTQLHQVLLNLCVNARDAMPDGGILEMKVENRVVDEHYAEMNLQAKTGPHVIISVIDSGTGIPPDVIDKIFDPFFTTKEISKGTGLGLSTVMAIVKSHGGFINVYSEPEKGTTFRVHLPAVTSSGETRELEAQPSLPRGDGETVLVVDDEASILTITSQTLEAFGYRILKANNGAAAVAVYAQHREKIAVVLTDMMMPVMDGRTTINALKQINPAVKIIAASGLTANADTVAAKGAGAKYFLSKPYTAVTLLNMLRTVLDKA